MLSNQILNLISASAMFITLNTTTLSTVSTVEYGLSPAKIERKLLSSKSIDLGVRNQNKFVSDIMADNSLLTLSYLNNEPIDPKKVDWNFVRRSRFFEFKLESGKTFAFQEDILDKYKSTLSKTTNAHFTIAEGFKDDGYLPGDGVCHLASFINWVSKDSGLLTEAPTNHDFATIPGVDQKYGVSISYFPGRRLNELNNLYVTNNLPSPIDFEFQIEGENLKLSIFEESSF